MKSFFVSAMIAIASVSTVYGAAVPDITDLLKGAAEKLKSQQGGSTSNADNSSSSGSSLLSGLKGAVEGMLGSSDLTEADLVGEYKYSGPAVSLKSENALQKLGGAAATGVAVEKLAPYYQKAGLENLTVTFAEDGNCEFHLKKATLKGTYAKADDGTFVFNFKVGGKIPLGKMTANVTKVGQKLSVTFDASKLIQIVNAVASVSGKASLQSVANLLNSYDGLYAGFELTKQ